MLEPKVGQRYEHFKGEEYLIIGVETAYGTYYKDNWDNTHYPPRWVSSDIENGDRYVVYRSDTRNYNCIRSVDSFNEHINRPRFELINGGDRK